MHAYEDQRYLLKSYSSVSTEINPSQSEAQQVEKNCTLACVASVSNRVIARKFSFPSPSPSLIFFCSCPSFLDEPREETLATQARKIVTLVLVQSQSTPSGKRNSRLWVSGTDLTRHAKPCMADVGSFFRLERQGTTPPLLPPFAREISLSVPPSNNRRLLRSLVHAYNRCGSTIAMNLFWIRESFCTKTVINYFSLTIFIQGDFGELPINKYIWKE